MPYRRPKRLRAKPRPTLHIAEILAWADDHKKRTGTFPTRKSGTVDADPKESWSGIDRALRRGFRGLPGRWSLSQLLAERRGYRNKQALPRLRVETILKWADEHQQRTGKFPTQCSGDVAASPGDIWPAIQHALRQGLRGLPAGGSLAQLLAEWRGYRNRKKLPRFRVQTILSWADEHQQRTGKFPTADSGAIEGASGETWMAVEVALRNGQRGLRGGSSLAKLLAMRRRCRNPAVVPRLSLDRILHWADRHKARTGNWPLRYSGPVADSPGDTWLAVERALVSGRRGLRGGSSLARLLAKRRGVRRHMRHPPLTITGILRWAGAHKKRTGQWPNQNSGPIPEAPGESWLRVHAALKQGKRDLPGGSSLIKLLAKHWGVRNPHDAPSRSKELRRK
jgi:hypothetical protein